MILNDVLILMEQINKKIMDTKNCTLNIEKFKKHIEKKFAYTSPIDYQLSLPSNAVIPDVGSSNDEIYTNVKNELVEICDPQLRREYVDFFQC